MNMDPDPEVIFKEKIHEKVIKLEGGADDVIIPFDFSASTPATPATGGGTEGRSVEDRTEDTIRSGVELIKFSLQLGKFDGKGDFKGWVKQFEEYATLGQWSDCFYP